MADPHARPGFAFGQGAPREVVGFLANKGLKPSFSFEDVEPEEHAVAFSVAKAMELDLLAAMKGEVEAALDGGLTFETFQKNWRANPKLVGWWGKQAVEDPETGLPTEVQLGSPHRLRTIYRANLRAARSAGQWERIQRTKAYFPYLEYRLGPSENHRKLHAQKAGLILPVDDPFWDEWMTPNGWGCKCWVRQVTRAEAERRGISAPPVVPDQIVKNERTGTEKIVPLGIDPEWARNPGKMRLQGMEAVLAEKIEALPEDIARAALRDIATGRAVRQILSGALPGAVPVTVLPAAIAGRLGAQTTLVRLSHETAGKQLRNHAEIFAQDYGRLVDLVESGRIIAQRDGHIALVGRGDLPWIAIVKSTRDGRELYLVSFYRIASARYLQKVEARGAVWRE